MLINSPNISGSLTVTGNATISGSLNVAGGISAAITGSATSASYVEYNNIANKPTLVSGSEQVSFNGITDKPTLVSGSSQIVYSGISSIPAGIVSSSAQVGGYGIFATTGSNQFNGSQAITGSLTVTGQVIAQTLNVQQVTSSIIYSSGSNVFGNSLSNTQQFTGSLSVTGSLTVNGAGTFASSVTATSFEVGNGQFFKARRSSSNLLLDLLGIESGTDNTRLLITGDFNIKNGSLATLFNMTTTGAATFSSNLTTNGKLTVSQASTDFVGEFINTSAANPYGIRVRDASGAANNYPLLQVVNNAGSVEYFRVNSGTGTATFSSSVTAAEGIINGTSTYLLSLNNTSQDVRLQLQVNGTQTFQLSSSSSQVNIYGATNIPMIFYTNATERMRITSGGNVGIGTTNPNARLQVGDGTQAGLNGAGNKIHIASNTSGGRSALLTLANSSGGTTVEGQFESSAESADLRVIIGSTSNHPVVFRASNTEYMRITSVGRLLFNSTTFAGDELFMFKFNTAGSYTQAINILDTNASANGSTFMVFRKSDDTYLGNIRRNGTGDAIYMGGNDHLALGSGNTERMRITSDGYLGIGTGSTTVSNGDLIGLLAFRSNDASTNSSGAIGSIRSYATADYNTGNVSGDLRFYTQDTGTPNGSLLSGAERVRITSGGSVGIGTGSPVSKLHVISALGTVGISLGESGNNQRLVLGQESSYTGNYINSTNIDLKLITYRDGGTGGTMLFYTSTDTNPAERMRITSGGNVGINTSNPTKLLHVSGNSAVLRVGPDYFAANGSADRDYIDLIADGVNTQIVSPNETFSILNPSGNIDIISQGSGGVRLTPGATSWTGISDLRLKNINSEITNATIKLNTLRAVNFSWKSDETQRENLGLIAQDVEAVFPQIVDTNKDGLMGVRYTELIPVLVKAVQELKSENDTLKSILQRNNIS